MKELEIVIDKNGLEKKIIISSGLISFDNAEDSINSKYDVSTIVIAGNGDFAPPFEKGSKVLREIRTSSGRELKDWKRIIPLGHSDVDFFKFNIPMSELSKQGSKTENWGLWICENKLEDSFPSIVVFNFPLWMLSHSFKNQEVNKEEFENLLSQTYRIILSCLSAFFSFHSGVRKGNSNQCLALSDIGNNLIDKKLIANLDNDEFLADDLYKMRIRIFTEVLSDWISRNDMFNKAIISYGGGIRTDLIERAWDLQAAESKDEIAEFGDALILREKNVVFLKSLIKTTRSKSLINLFQMSIDSFHAGFPSLSADLIQSRTLVEGISLELCDKFNLKAQSANLFAYIQRLEESKKISPWITSYFHVIRQLGNEAAHYKANIERRPEMPVGKDLIVIHAALNRILSFCIDENI
jgi:hypothetical protein